jgi:hypothetical protein
MLISVLKTCSYLIWIVKLSKKSGCIGDIIHHIMQVWMMGLVKGSVGW